MSGENNRYKPTAMQASPPLMKWGLYFIFLLLIAALYSLAHVFPAYIGTGYIGIYLTMMGASLICWKYIYIPPKHILWLGIIALLLLFPLAPLISNDSERYLWDGAVFLSGLDPYVTAPDTPAVSDLRAIWPTPEEHAAYPTLYPPGALSLFAISALGGPVYGVWIWKAIATLSAIVSLILAYDMLKRRHILRNLPLIILSPLLLLETSAGLHIDIFCVLGITAALSLIDRDRFIWAGIIIGLAASIKFLPAVIAGPLLFYVAPKKAVRLFLAASLTWLSIYLVMFGFGYKPLGLLPTFFEKWRGGAPIYPLIEAISTALKLSNTAVLALIGSLAISAFAASAWLANRGHIIVAISLSLAVPLLLSPVLFPWYLMALIPLLALRPNMTILAAICLAPLSYIVLNKWLSQGIWDQPAWPPYILLIGLVCGLAYDLRKIRPRANL